MTTRRDLDNLAGSGSRAVGLAQAELESFFFGLDLSRPELVRDSLLEFLPTLAREYGDVAATAAAEWYEAQRASQVGGRYSALLGNGVEVAQAQGSVRYAAGHLWDQEKPVYGGGPGGVVQVGTRLVESDPAQTLAVLSGSLQRFVLYASRDTVARNVQRDPAKPRFGRVPTGAKTCAWCSMLSSRGFVYLTKETAGIARDDFHDDCDCQIVAEFDKDAHHIDGYDPDAMYAMYKAAWEKAGGRGADQKTVAALMRRMFPESFTDGAVSSL